MHLNPLLPGCMHGGGCEPLRVAIITLQFILLNTAGKLAQVADALNTRYMFTSLMQS